MDVLEKHQDTQEEEDGIRVKQQMAQILAKAVTQVV